MNFDQLFKINYKLQITLAGRGETYTTTIQDVNKHLIYLAIPTGKGRPLVVNKGDTVEVKLIAQDALVTFITTVVGIKVGDQIPLLMLNKPAKVIREQRRQYYRCPLLLDMDFLVISDNGPANADQQGREWRGARVLDLAGGGIRFSTSACLSEGDFLNVRIYLQGINKQDIVTASGEIVQVYNAEPKAGNFIYGLSFTEISEHQREQIINYIFTITRNRVY